MGLELLIKIEKGNPVAMTVRKKNIVRVMKPAKNQLVSPGLWNVFDTFVKVHHSLYALPFTFQAKNHQLILIPPSARRRLWVQLYHSLLPITIVAFVLILFHKLHGEETSKIMDVWETARICILITVVVQILCFTVASFILAFIPECFCHVVNPIEDLEHQFSGNLISYFKILKTAA